MASGRDDDEVEVQVTGADLKVKYSSKTTKVTLKITEKN